MADYFPLISRAVTALSPNTREAREALYARAREALTRQLTTLDPPIPEADLWRERNALEETIRRVEVQFPPPPRPEARPVPPPMPVVVPGPPKGIRPTVPAPGAKVADPARGDGGVAAAEPKPDQDEEPVTGPEAAASDAQAGEIVKRPKVGATEGASKAFRSRKITGIVFALPLMLAVGGLAYVLRDDPALYDRKEPAPAQPDAAAQRKSDGRLDGTSSQAPVSGPRPATQQPSVTPALPVASRAIFFEETASDPRGIQSDGQIIWRLETVAGATGQPPETAARGSVAFPAARMGLEIVFRRNRDAALPASHTVELVFKPEEGREGVTEIGPIEARDQESQPGYQLRGAMVPVGVNLFLVGLDRSDAVAERNVEAMRDQRFFAFQFRMANNRVGAILIEKGQTGDRVFREATEAWKR
jgi:hypothetical protein